MRCNIREIRILVVIFGRQEGKIKLLGFIELVRDADGPCIILPLSHYSIIINYELVPFITLSIEYWMGFYVLVKQSVVGFGGQNNVNYPRFSPTGDRDNLRCSCDNIIYHGPKFAGCESRAAKGIKEHHITPLLTNHYVLPP